MSAPIDDLRQYVAILEKQGELCRITAETDPVLEIAAITDRVCKSPAGGSALLFEQPTGARFSVATNLFGSLRRVCLSLGVGSLAQVTERLTGLLRQVEHLQFDRLHQQLSALPEFSRCAPLLSATHSHEHVVMDMPDLSVFPFLQSWPEDGSAEGYPRYITLPQVFTADPQGQERNCGLYRVQVRGTNKLAIRWKTGSGAAGHLEQHRRAGKPMPVAIVLGGPPSVLFSAMFPLPGALDEMTFAGFLRGAPLEMVACRTVALQVPAGAEIVIEGYVYPADTVEEGPFGNHTGSYSPAGSAALMRVTAISHRRDALVPATVVGPPPMEDCWMAQAWSAVLRAFLQRLVPAITDISFPRQWVFHQSAVISLESPQPGMVRETAEQLWRLPWFSAARVLIFVDAADNVADYDAIAWRAINRSDFSRDMYADESQTRMALDATSCHGGHKPIAEDTTVVERVRRRWQELGLGEL